MNDVLLFGILGLGAGAAYALVAQGLILVYRATGVVNFAQGAIALTGASTYVWLTNQHGLSPVAATLVTLLAMGALGALIQRLVMRPLGRAPMLAKLVSVLGLILLLQGIVLLAFGTDFQTVQPLIPFDSMEMFGVTFGRDRAILFVMAIVLAAALSWFGRYTTQGTLFRAAADSEEGVAILGYSLNAIATSAWVAGAMLAGFAGIVIAPITTLNSITIVLIVIPAVAVALLSGFQSFWVATGAALLLGVLQAEVARYWTASTPTIQGMQQALPFVLIIIVMVVRGRAIPGRGTITLGRPPLAPPVSVGPVGMSVLVTATIAVTYLMSHSYQFAMATGFASAIVALSLVVLTGYVGQISLAQMTFAGLGALFCSWFANNLNLPFPLPIIAAGLAVVPFGVLLGIPALRVRGVSLAVVTLGAAVAIDGLVFSDTSITGGTDGISIPSPELFGYSIDSVIHPFRYAMFTLFVLIVCMVGVGVLRRSRLGLKMLATRDNERAAAAEGISTMQTKLVAFAIAAFLAGVAGGLLGYLYGRVTFDAFGPLASVFFVTTAYIGGIGSIWGAVIAGMVTVGGPLFNLLASSNSVDKLALVISGAGVILTAILNPDGIAPAFGKRFQLMKEKQGRGKRKATERATDEVSIDEAASKRDIVRPPVGEPILEARGLTVRFGAVVAVDDVDLTVRKGTIVGLIGPNGAGKTTLIDAVCGFVPSTGDVTFEGRPMNRLAVHRRAHHGLRRSFQSVELFEDLTVHENLVVPARAEHDGQSEDSQLSVDEVLALVGLDGKADLYPRELSAGETKLVGLARALRGGPKVLLLDEPAAGLDSGESRQLGDHLVLIAAMGITIVLVDHDLDLVMGVCDEVVVLDRGRLLAVGPPDEVRRDPKVRAAYIGAEPDGEHEIDASAEGIDNETVEATQ